LTKLKTLPESADAGYHRDFDRQSVFWKRLPRRLHRSLARNGVRWTAYASVLALLRQASKVIQRRMIELERKHGLAGSNNIRSLYDMWQWYDWRLKGEEWSPSPIWKQSVIDHVMVRWIEPGQTVLEIGPGVGRWTEPLIDLADRLIVVDLSDRCIDLCRERFQGATNMEFQINDGRTLPGVASDSVDGVWSWDVFTMVAPHDIDSYLAELARVMRAGGRAVIHHAKEGGRATGLAADGWRSHMTAELFNDMLNKHGLRLIEQFDSWGPSGRFDVKKYRDVVSVFEK
jgi:ubiquinone/menaquinone biosynthesis C-methylase UbiE